MRSGVYFTTTYEPSYALKTILQLRSLSALTNVHKSFVIYTLGMFETMPNHTICMINVTEACAFINFMPCPFWTYLAIYSLKHAATLLEQKSTMTLILYTSHSCIQSTYHVYAFTLISHLAHITLY